MAKEKVVNIFNCDKNRCIYISFKWLCLSVSLALLDISSKFWIKSKFLVGDILYVFPGINCYYINNSGLAFGLFSNIGKYYQWVFIGIIVLLIVLFFIALYKSVSYKLKYDSLAYSIVIGGAIGNLYDRILYGVVIDFIDIYIFNWHWPIFNIADMEISIGLILLIMKRTIPCIEYTKS